MGFPCPPRGLNLSEGRTSGFLGHGSPRGPGSSRAAKRESQIYLMGRTPPHLSGGPPDPEPLAREQAGLHSDLKSPRCGMRTTARGPRCPAEPREEPFCRYLRCQWNVGFCASAVSRDRSFAGEWGWVSVSSHLYPGGGEVFGDAQGSGALASMASPGPWGCGLLTPTLGDGRGTAPHLLLGP